MSKGLRRWAVERHLSAADERFGLRLGAGLVVTLVAAVAFVLLLLLVRAGWAPLRDLDAGTAQAFNQIGTAHPELVKSAEVVSDVLDPNVFRIALTVIALVYLIHGERHHATWLLVTVFGGAAIGLALKVIVHRARPVLPDPVPTAPGMSFPSGHALGASIGCCLLLRPTKSSRQPRRCCRSPGGSRHRSDSSRRLGRKRRAVPLIQAQTPRSAGLRARDNRRAGHPAVHRLQGRTGP